MRFHRFDFRSVIYASPDVAWRCGRHAEDGGCAAGPDRRGRCRTGECLPERGPRGRRLRLTWLLLALLLGAAALSIADPARMGWVFSPGPLDYRHAAIEDCATCHKGWEAGPAGWIVAATAMADHSDRCLACHDQGRAPLGPHGLSGALLEALAGTPLPVAATRDIACARCHREHEGERGVPPAVDARRCQACHTRPFGGGGLAAHAAFSDYPASGERGVRFDHRAHYRARFPKDPAWNEASCWSCHVPRARMDLRPYAETCAPCHQSQLDGRTPGAGPPGVPVLAVPELDGAPAPWPTIAAPGMPAIMARLMPGLPDDPGARAATIRDLLRDLAEGGGQKLGERFAAAAARGGAAAGGLPRDALRALIDEAFTTSAPIVPAEAVAPAVPAEAGEWILVEDAPSPEGPGGWILEEDDGGAPATATAAPEPPAAPPESVDSEAWAAHGGWYRQQATLFYRPTVHGDAFMRAWIEAAVAGDDAALIRAVAEPGAPGRCVKCHAVEQAGTGRAVRWKPRTAADAPLPFTRFDHAAHFGLTEGQRCHACHAWDETPAPGPTTGFRPVTLSDCTECHVEGRAGEDCVLCHRYHVEPRTPQPVRPVAPKGE